MPKLLIVDDDDAVREMLRERLEDCHEIVDTGRPEEALAIALRVKPDCILMDLMMPALSGMELCQTFKSLSYTHAIPIFILTGEPTEQYRDFCLGIGAAEYFEKPLDMDRFKKRLAEVLQLKPPQRRHESRLRLKVALKLRGVDANGKPFELLTMTENVSASGFFCGLSVPLREGSSVEVLLETGGERIVGKARVVRSAYDVVHGQHFAFEFTERAGGWLLG